MKTRALVEPHLVIHEVRLPKGGEWRPHFRGWCLSHVESGISYWQEQNETREVPTGSTLVVAAEARGVLRASQLSEVTLCCFCVDAEKLPGLMSLREQLFLKQAAERKSLAVQVFSAESPLSARFKSLRSQAGAAVASTRLRLLQLFMDVFEWESDPGSSAPAPCMDGRERFRQVLNQMAASELAEMSVSDLAPMMSCSRRHLNRLFREELGFSFREKQVELRLAKACELLASSNAKVVEVALESGYQSSSVFSEMFKKRFGVSPGRWRLQRVKSRAPSRLRF
jgi:AraC-like DNA-binding protein